MASSFIASVNPQYGPIGGYNVVDETGASPPPSTATIINATVAGQPITSANTIQFVNLEAGGSGIVHSAVGFTGASFPAKPFPFPSPLATPTESSISNSAAWSTGLIGSPVQTVCYSQEFALRAGTYYFGDFNYYNITTFQDVLVVAQ